MKSMYVSSASSPSPTMIAPVSKSMFDASGASPGCGRGRCVSSSTTTSPPTTTSTTTTATLTQIANQLTLRAAAAMTVSSHAISRGVTPNGASPAAPPSGAVSTQMPPSCTATLCSQWEPAVPSSVETVQSSSSTNVAWSPMTTIGSIASDEAGPHLGPRIGHAVVEHRRRLVHLAADAVADVLAQDAVAAPPARSPRCSPAPRRRPRRGGEPWRARRCPPTATPRSRRDSRCALGDDARGATDPARTTVNAESPFQPLYSAPASIERMSPGSSTPVAGDPVHDLLVDRRADRVAIPAHHLEVRLRAPGA